MSTFFLQYRPYVGDLYHGVLSSPSVTLMDILCLKSGVSYCFPCWSALMQPTYLCSTVACVLVLDPHLDSIQGLGRMNWKGRSVAGGDFGLCSLASFPAANWPLQTAFEKTEFLLRVWGDIIVLLLHNPGHAIKIAFIHWMLSMGQALRHVLYTHPVTTALEVAISALTLQMRKQSLGEVKQLAQGYTAGVTKSVFTEPQRIQEQLEIHFRWGMTTTAREDEQTAQGHSGRLRDRIHIFNS